MKPSRLQHRIQHRSLPASILLCLIASLLPGGLHAQTNGLTVLRNATEVLRLSREEAAKSHPVQIQGVVTCWDPRMNLSFIQDASGGVYFYPESFNIKVGFGDLVEMSGVSSSGRYSPIILWAKVGPAKPGTLPVPKRVSIENLTFGQEDCQWVELEGVIRKTNREPAHFVFELAAGADRLPVRVLDYSADSPDMQHLVPDTRVSVRGVVCTTYDEKSQVSGFNLLVQNPGLITILDRAAPDPFGGPPISTKDLLSFARKENADRRAHLRGVVLLHRPGRDLIIRDESGGIKVQSTSQTLLNPGDVVEVAGFPSPLGRPPAIEEAIYRKLGVTNLPTPISITTTQALTGAFENQSVTIEGKLAAKESTESGLKVLVMEANRSVFRAYLDSGAVASDFESLQPRSRLRVTGVCQISRDPQRFHSTFSVLVPPKATILELEPPPGSRLTTLAWFSGGAGILSLLAVGWVTVMRREVAQRTDLIRRREQALEERYRDLFENANDLIYSHDLQGKITSVNRAGEHLFGYTAAELLQMNMFDFVVPEHRATVRSHMESKLNGVSRTNYEIRTKSRNGHQFVLEVNSRLHFEEGKLIGIKGIARDITARKEAEAALIASEQELKQSLEERERLGQNLHDGIIQSIYAVGLNLEDCRRSIHQDPAHVEQRLRGILGNLNDVIRDVRNFIMGLESDVLKGQEFKTALKSLVITLGESHMSKFSMQVDPIAAASLSPAQATQLLHIAREAMSNSIRHSEAQRTTLSLGKTEESFRFEIQDDGVGFNPGAVEGQGHGLRNMAARAANLGAAFRVISQVGEGTRIMLDIPRKKQHQIA